MSIVDIDAKIPNNVDLAGDRRLQRALESWQPKFIEWWKTARARRLPGQRRCTCARRSPSARKAGPTSTTCEMPDYRWGIFLAEPRAGSHDRVRRPHGRAGVAGGAGRVPLRAAPPARRAGRHRAGVGRAAAAAVPDRAEPVRPAQPVPGQRRGGPAPVGDGVPAAPLLRPRRARRGRRDARAPLRRRRQPAHPRRVQRADARLAVVLLLHLLHRPRRQVPARVAARESAFDPLSSHVRLHAEGGGAPHVRRRHRHRPRRRSAPSS